MRIKKREISQCPEIFASFKDRDAKDIQAGGAHSDF
jgi:hypothetical protein